MRHKKNSRNLIVAGEKISGKFYGSKKIRENIFPGVREISGKTFPGKSGYARTHAKTKFLLAAQNPVHILSKPQFSDVNSIAGYQGHLLPDSPENHAILNAKK